MSLTVFVPCDAASVAVGANRVADKLACLADERALDLNIIRNSSYGLFWLEPLIEIETPSGRMAFGPVSPDDLDSLIEAGVFSAKNDFSNQAADMCATESGKTIHPLCLGLTQNIPYLRKQHRQTFFRLGVTRPHSLSDYIAHNGFKGLKRALSLHPKQIIQAILDSGLRGRGGAAFPTGIKWQTVLNTPSTQKYIVCNADEGDSGTFSDRMIMEGDPFSLIEGMIIAGLATGATKGYIYVRSEYPQAFSSLGQAIGLAEQAGYLGQTIMGHDRDFTIILRKAAGSYVCGEETALLESLEGKRGIVRSKPPLPAIKGLFGQPTVINNVITLAGVPNILAQTDSASSGHRVGTSGETLPFQLAGNVKRGGIVEVPFGITLRELVFDFGGGTANGRPVKAIQVGGPLGTYVPEKDWDLPMTYENYKAIGATLGHGGIVVHDDTADMSKLARYAMAFCALESCGKCTPCRIGSTRGVEIIDNIRTDRNRDRQITLLRDLCDTMKDGSLCAMGSMTPNPVLSALNHYPADFGQQDAQDHD